MAMNEVIEAPAVPPKMAARSRWARIRDSDVFHSFTRDKVVMFSALVTACRVAS